MRIAISGTHATGKSTLAAELARRLGYDVIEEPYYALADEGHPFEDVPTADDFGAMLDRAVADLSATHSPGIVFDRSPADYLSYLVVLRGSDGVVEETARTARAMSTLDLIVFVPIEDPDRIQPGRDEAGRLRKQVDRLLRALLVEGGLRVRAPVVEVSGALGDRVEQVLAAVTAG